MPANPNQLLIPNAEDVRYYLEVSRLKLSHQTGGSSRLSIRDDMSVHLPNGEVDTIMGDYRNLMSFQERPFAELGTPEAEMVSYKLGLVVGSALAKSGTLLHDGFDAVARDLAEGTVTNG